MDGLLEDAVMLSGETSGRKLSCPSYWKKVAQIIEAVEILR
jgi:hypothetical protein